MRVLIVDDNRELADNVGEVLTHEGLRCTVVHDAALAIAKIAGTLGPPFDLVITDWSMGSMGGLAVIAAVRRRSPRTGVLLVTALPEQLCLGREQAAVFEVVGKPFDTGALVALVHRCLARHGAVSSSQAAIDVLQPRLRAEFRDLPCAP